MESISKLRVILKIQYKDKKWKLLKRGSEIGKIELREAWLYHSFKENRDYVAEPTFEKIMTKNFPEMMKGKNETKEAHCIPNGRNKNEAITMHLPLKL